MTAESHKVSRRTVLGAGAAAAAVVVTGPGAPAAEPVAAPNTPAIPPAAEPCRRAGPRIDVVCGACGGNHVSRDAWAEWDAGEQEWVLGAVFDYGHCHDCDGEASLEEVAL